MHLVAGKGAPSIHGENCYGIVWPTRVPTVQNPGGARVIQPSSPAECETKIRIIPPARASRPHRYNSRPVHCRRARIICDPTRRRRIDSAASLASIRLAAGPHTPSEIGRSRCPQSFGFRFPTSFPSLPVFTSHQSDPIQFRVLNPQSSHASPKPLASKP
jgi:hypothetical protein